MTTGELFLESLRSGVITQAEIDWLLNQQDHFARTEQAAMQRLGRLLDQGEIQLGCRVGRTAATSAAPGADRVDRPARTKAPILLGPGRLRTIR